MQEYQGLDGMQATAPRLRAGHALVNDAATAARASEAAGHLRFAGFHAGRPGDRWFPPSTAEDSRRAGSGIACRVIPVYTKER